MWYMHDDMGWWMALWGFLMVLFWGLVIALGVWAVVKIARRDERVETRRRTNPLDIAKERYARGELSRQEFEQIKKDLSG